MKHLGDSLEILFLNFKRHTVIWKFLEDALEDFKTNRKSNEISESLEKLSLNHKYDFDFWFLGKFPSCFLNFLKTLSGDHKTDFQIRTKPNF